MDSSLAMSRERKYPLLGRPPLGFTKEKDSKELIIDEIKAEVVRRIFKLYLDGASVCSICKLFKLSIIQITCSSGSLGI